MPTVLTPRATRKANCIRYFHKMDSNTKKPKTDSKGNLIPLSDKHMSQTQQHFLSDVNINSVIARARKTGVLRTVDYVSNLKPMFVDLTTIPDLKTAQNILVDANNAFMSLPSEIRSKFDNDPQKLINFVNDPANNDEAIELGLLPKPISNDDSGSDIAGSGDAGSANDAANASDSGS